MAKAVPNSKVLRNATRQQLEQAAVTLHTQVFELVAQAQHGQVFYKDGLTYTISSQTAGTVAFPMMDEDKAGALLDEMMDFYRSHNVMDIGCYSLDPPQPRDLGILLLARGFQNSWTPCWMALDLDALQNDDTGATDLTIKADLETSTNGCTELPYYGDTSVITHSFLLTYPHRSQRFLAYMDGRIVAQSCVFFTTGDNAVAGIFNVGVVPSYRNKGIGKAVVLAACRYAKEQGYGYAVLNATGRRMYNQLGFQWIGYGLTWRLINDRYITHPPSSEEVLFAESVARGDIKTLENIKGIDLNAPITNGMRLMELAAQFQQTGSAQWLMHHGAECTALDAWDLTWKDTFLALLPIQVNRTYGVYQETLLHIAARRNDLELATLTLQAQPDTTIKDAMHDANALNWARYFGRTDLINLLAQYMQSK